MSRPRYSVIKDYIIGQIESRAWRSGDRVPSENDLAARFAVSRMTSRRALQELSEEGILVRTQGLGSFVADARPRSSILEIHSIDQEIKARGHTHAARVIKLGEKKADNNTALLLGLKKGTPVYHSVLLHSENGSALQYEERHVNPQFGPAYLDQDFTRITPSRYLSSISPLTEADQTIEAVTVSKPIAKLLEIAASEPCLKVSRRTWCQQGIVNIVTLYYPGSRYRLGGHLKTEEPQ
ncbi:MAG: GntR family histidine utilization transcriptional repressor [Glaciecola sp.]|jgi:GntR family histidine utilization transcriptional repressor|uniref:histidine utilization repressor n=1 Tax=Congregibacter sp. TaxID=2744308 RepID=UPI0039E32002